MGSFVYVGGLTTQTVRKLQKSDLAQVAETADFGNAIMVLAEDEDFVYVGWYGAETVRKLQKSDLTQVAASADHVISYALAAEDVGYVYTGSRLVAPQPVLKLQKSDLAQVAESASYAGTPNALAEDGDFVYVGGSGPQTVKKLQKSDLTQVQESASYGGIIRALAEDADFVYVGGATTRTVKKLQKSNLAQVQESANYGGDIRALAEDADYVYVGGHTTRTVKKLRKSDLVQVAESTAYGGDIYALAEDEGFVYVGGATTQTVKKLQKSNLAQVEESASYGGTIRALTEDEEAVVVPTETTDPATSVEAMAATGNGNITDNGGEDCDKRGFVYDTSPHGDPGDTAPADSEYAGYVEETDSFGIGAFTGSLTSLEPNTPYYVRSYAHNSAGYSYGNEVSFTTLVATPTVTTDAATALSAIAATLNGTLNQDGGEACGCGFEWGPDTNYGVTTLTQSKITGQTFSQVIGGLFPNTTYHFRAFTTNSAGTSYGADRTFTTAPVMSKAYALAREEL